MSFLRVTKPRVLSSPSHPGWCLFDNRGIRREPFSLQGDRVNSASVGHIGGTEESGEF